MRMLDAVEMRKRASGNVDNLHHNDVIAWAHVHLNPKPANSIEKLDCGGLRTLRRMLTHESCIYSFDIQGRG